MLTDNYINSIISSCAEIISLEDLKSLSYDNFSVKVGFDPTTSDLHLGHLIIILKLKQLQELNFKVCIIIGDFTALIGDPSGRNSARPILSNEEIAVNYKTYFTQLFKFLNPKLTSIYFNSSWFNNFPVDSLLKLISYTTVSQMLERNDFQARFSNQSPIFLNEFIYPLLQAYDSVFLNIDLELGGIDQKFNFLIARDIQKRFCQKNQIVLMMPLLLGIDGKNKMSKSLKNSINLTDDFYDIFCKVMSIPDFLIKDYFIYLNIADFESYVKLNEYYNDPMKLKKLLAFKIVELIYNDEHAKRASDRFEDIFSKRVMPEDIDITDVYIDLNFINLFELLVLLKLVSSKSEFKRFLLSSSIKVNNEVVSDKFFILSINNYYYIKFGKKVFLKIFLKKK